MARIGIIALPHIARALAAAGFEVVDGVDALESAKAVRQAINDASDPLGKVIIATSAFSGGVGAAMSRFYANGVLFVAVGDPAEAQMEIHCPVVMLPASASEILTHVGVEFSSDLAFAADGTAEVEEFDFGPPPVVVPATGGGPAPERLFRPLNSVDTSEAETGQLAPQPAPPPVEREVAAPSPATSTSPGEGPGGGWRHLLDDPSPGSALPPPTPPVTQNLPAVFEPETLTPPPPVQPTVVASGSGDVLACVARKGGVGKTSMSMIVAEYAARQGLSVLLIDANFGQADIAGSVGIPRGSNAARLTDILAVTPLDITRGVTSAAQLSSLRNSNVLHFDVLLGMTDSEAEKYSDLLTDRYVAELVEAARSRYRLVVIDTQIIDVMSQLNVADEVVVPLAAEGLATIVGLTGAEENSAINLHRKMQSWNQSGVQRSRMLTVFNRQSQDAAFRAPRAVPLFANVSTVIGELQESPEMASLLATRLFDRALAFAEPQIRAVLFAATGLQVFAPLAPTPTPSRRFKLPWIK